MTFPIRPAQHQSPTSLSSTRYSAKCASSWTTVLADAVAPCVLLCALSAPVFAVPSSPTPSAMPSATPSVTPSVTTPPTITTPMVAAAPIASSTANSANASAIVSAASLSAFNVLLVPLDHLGNTASDTASLGNGITDSATELAAGSEAAIVVGPAQAAAAPLRRALLKRGLSDVLTAAPNSSVLRRAVAENRLSQRVLDQLNEAMSTIAASVSLTTSDASAALMPPTSVSTAPSSSSSTSTAPAMDPSADNPNANASSLPAIVPSVMLSAQVNSFESATQRAIAAASRLGQALNYRAVLILTLTSDSAGKTHYVMLLVDALRETGDVTTFDVPAASSAVSTTATTTTGTTNANRLVSYQNSAEVGSTLLQQKLAIWAQAPSGDRNKITADSLATARAALSENRLSDARDALSRVLAFDATQRDALMLLGDVQLKGGDADAAILSYRRAAALDGDKGAAWAQIATAYAASSNWPETLNAGKQALAANTDSVALRLAMATAQLGRAQLFTDAGRAESADDALQDAAIHLAQARQMAPDDPAVLRLLAQQLTMQNQSRQALQMLDRAAPQLIGDRDFQVSYATLLAGRDGRERDAFAAWMRATKLSNDAAANPGSSTGNATQLPTVDRARFRRLVEGYDQTVAKMVMRAYALTDGVVQGNISRDSALLELKPMTDDIALANSVLKSLTPPDDRQRDAYTARLAVGDTFSQAINAYEMYAENSDDSLHDKAIELHKDAMARLNALRSS